jgi:hypothetical protein
MAGKIPILGLIYYELQLFSQNLRKRYSQSRAKKRSVNENTRRIALAELKNSHQGFILA